MTFTSVLEDLRGNTLKAISGCLQRLEYLSRLQVRKGFYTHWGLARVYGAGPTNKALEETHRSVLSEVLATPIQDLLQDVERSSELAGVLPTTYMDELNELQLLPPGPAAGTASHLNSVLHALSSLTKNSKQKKNQIPDATPPTS